RDAGREALADAAEQIGDSDSAQVQSQLALLRAGEDEEVLRQRAETIDLDDPRRDGRPHLLRGLRIAERELQLGLVQGEGGAELVTRVVDEGSLALQGRLQAAEHR